MSINIYRVSVFFVGLFLMFLIETLRPNRKWQDPRKKRLLFHLSLAIFNSIILRLPAFLPLLLWREYVFARQWGIIPFLNLNPITGIILGLVVWDIFNYWWHRFNHRISFLWRFHKVHHVDTHVDVTTSLRFHPGELFISAIVKSTWVLALGPSIWAFVIFETAITTASQFHHSNIDFPDKIEYPLRKLFVTPRYHTSHHTVTPRTGNANFSAIFIFWDKIFATYNEPDREEMKLLGLCKGRESYLSVGSTLKGPFGTEY